MMEKLRKWKNFFSLFVRRYIDLFLISVFLQILFYLMGVARPYLYKYVIDALVQKNMKLLKIGVIGYSLVQIFTLIFLLLQRYFRYKLDLKVIRDVNLELFRKCLTTDYSKVFKIPTGQLMQRFSDDVNRIFPLAAQIPGDLIGRLIFFFGILLIMFKLSVELTIIPLVFMGLYLIGYKKYSRIIPEVTVKRQNAYSNYLKELEEGLNLGYTSRIHNAWQILVKKFQEAIDTYIKNHFKFAMVNAAYQGILTNGIYLISIVAVLIAGVIMVNKGSLTVGTVVAFVSYTGYLYDFISFLTTFNTIVEPAFVSLDRVNELLTWEEKFNVSKHRSVSISPSKYAIEVKNLTFELNGKRIFNNLSFNVEYGKFTAIFGRSGGGKTTLINLFLKIYEPPEKSIFVFGRDLKEIPIEEIYGIFSVVEQEPLFLTGSIEDNIHGGKWEDVMKVADILGLRDFLEDIMKKERAAKLKDLSGGERKRLRLLRALSNPRPIVLLDEPTAFLDEITSTKILDGLKRLLQNRTVVVFTHDYNVTRICDIVYDKLL